MIKLDDYIPFPEVESGVRPNGSLVLVQIRSPRTISKGGIILTAESVDTIMWNDQVAKVLALGPLAYKDRRTGEPWPEGLWAEPGTLVRVPKYGGDRWTIEYGKDGQEKANFALFKDTDILGKVPDPDYAHKIKAYV